MFYCGGRIGIYSGDFKDLSRDLPVLQPTVMMCVPRILNRIYNRVSFEELISDFVWSCRKIIVMCFRSYQK